MSDFLFGKFDIVFDSQLVKSDLTSTTGIVSGLYDSILRSSPEAKKRLEIVKQQFLNTIQQHFKIVSTKNGKSFIPELSLKISVNQSYIDAQLIEISKDIFQKYRLKPFSLLHLGLCELQQSGGQSEYIILWRRRLPYVSESNRQHKIETDKYKSKQNKVVNHDFKKLILTGLVTCDDQRRLFLTDKGNNVLEEIKQRFAKVNSLPKIKDLQFQIYFLDLITFGNSLHSFKPNTKFSSDLRRQQLNQEIKQIWKKIFFDHNLIDSDLRPTVLGIKFLSTLFNQYLTWRVLPRQPLDNIKFDTLLEGNFLQKGDSYLLSLLRDTEEMGLILNDIQDTQALDYVKKLLSFNFTTQEELMASKNQGAVQI